MPSQTAAPIIIEACPTPDISVPAVRLVHPDNAGNYSRRACPLTEPTTADSSYTSTSNNNTAFDNSTNFDNSNRSSHHSKDVFGKSSELSAGHRSALASNEACRDLVISVLQQSGAPNGYTMDEIHSKIENHATKQEILNILVNDRAFQARKAKYGCRWVLNELFLAKMRIKRSKKYKRKLSKIAKLERKIAKLERERETVQKRRKRLDQKESARLKKLANIEHSLASVESDLYSEANATRSTADGGASTSVETKPKDPDNSWCPIM